VTDEDEEVSSSVSAGVLYTVSGGMSDAPVARLPFVEAANAKRDPRNHEARAARSRKRC
jgi:hypothetical protein